MDVVLDTNIAVSASISRVGNPGTTIREWEADRFRWVTSAPLLEELERTLRSERLQRYMTWDTAEIDVFISSVRNRCSIISPRDRIDVISADPDDNRVLEAAVEGGAEFIVTGDHDLLDLARYETVEIVTPAQFLAILAEATST